MGCSHNYVFTQGYFVCTKCGKRSYGRAYKKKQRSKLVGGILVGLVLVIAVYAYSNGIFQINQDELKQSLQKIPDSLPENFVGDARDTISEIKIPKVDINEIEITSPLRVESGFDSTLIEQYIYEFTNNERQKQGLSKLNRISLIDSIARNHSEDMSNRNFFSHDTPEGLDPTDRGNSAGYNCQKNYGSYYTYGLAENIFQSYTYSSYMTQGIKSSYTWMADEEAIAKEIIDGWMDSPGHRANILEKKYDRIGVGVSINSDEVVYSTQNFC
ncbi:CAP domain-containing protein [Nitrosopumilus adriaticus]|uniref:SCP domain-containing protein n=1 Tax=Nitrosopumilus adriaticus TaxID=1580092 RepID=A0A0D5C335_9ARCH|nr:CAP domain-containing protein [Nitrosopumilus adriaticus]AJW71224.1 hypothetical protein NADRNF5_1543 [Nitrosopumilus adriaticus]